jgi:hypothetical protein
VLFFEFNDFSNPDLAKLEECSLASRAATPRRFRSRVGAMGQPASTRGYLTMRCSWRAL